MMEWSDDLIFVGTHVSLIILATSALLAVIRLILGPTLPDRIVAVDLIALIVVAMILTYAISTGNSVFLDVAIGLALVVFLSTVAFARYLEKGLQK
jgi:multicomponent Na+:H+ antiporter subunit F